MKFHLVGTLAAAALVSGAGLGHAQTQQGQQDWRADRDRAAQMQNGSQAAQRDEQMMRQALQQAGFSSIRILDAAYLVQARTPDDRQVMMFIDPPRRDATSLNDDMRDLEAWADRRTGSDDRRQSGALQPFRDRMERNARAPQDMRGSRDMSASRDDGDAVGRDAQVGRFDTLQAFGDRTDTERQHPSDRTQAFADMEAEDRAQGFMRAQGMQNVRDLEREDENGVVATVDWYGEEVEVRIDLRSGEVVEPARLSDAQIRNKLEDEGWEDVRNVDAQDDVIQLRADYDGESFELRLHPQDGRLMQWREADAG